MDKDVDQLAKRLADACVDLSYDERQEYLDSECGGDDELRQRVEMSIRESTGSETTQAFSNDYERVLPRHYRLIELLGRGGMAEVFLAEDARLHRRVAIKFLNSEFRKDPERMRRFQQEARAASALNHPNILIIHDIGENEGIQYLVSEFVQGQTLSSRISRGNIDLSEAVDIAIHIASALAVSHAAGIVHRDIKPDNVMIRPDGSIKVLDFGLAKDTGSFSRAADRDANTYDKITTSPGMIMGTPQYMSPEQARGSQLDARTDIFSLGIILFEMVTGNSPFAGTTMADTIAAILTKEPGRLAEYLDDPPPTLVRIVETALKKDRAERYGSMDLFVSDLRELEKELAADPGTRHVVIGTPTAVVPKNTVRTVAARFMHWEPILLGLFVALLAAAAWWYFRGSLQPSSLMQGSMKSIAITSWNSRPGELTASASFSPDARMVAFASTQSGAKEIWVKPTAGGDAVQVTKNGFDNLYPVWSPNGEEIAFYSNRSGSPGIWRTAFTGGAQHQILAGGGAPKPVYWSKSGKIYFQDRTELYSVNERSAEKVRLTNFDSQGVVPRSIAVSADESTIAYSIKENDIWKLKVERLDTGTSEEIGSSKEQIDNIAWQSDGQTVFFSTSVDAGAYQIFQTGKGYAAPIQLSTGNSDFYVQDISADGSKILYGSVSESSDLWSVDVETSKESLVANDVESEYWADISPDGTRVTYQSVNQTDRAYSGSIKVRSLIGDAAPTLISQAGFSPVWAPNGESVAFFKKSETGIDIWRAKPFGGDAVKLAAGAVTAPGYTATPYLKIGVNHIAWSPNGADLAYSAQNDGISNIWLASSDGSRNSVLTTNKDAMEIYCCPVWARDGKSILFTSAFVSREAGLQSSHRILFFQIDGAQQRPIWESKERFRFLGLDETGKNAIIAQRGDPADLSSTPALTYVYSVSIQTGAKQKVNTIGNAYFHNIHLSRDGKSIAFVSRGENSTALWLVPVSGGSPRKLLDEKDPKVLISSLTWSPDGRSIVFGRQTRTNLLSMLAK